MPSQYPHINLQRQILNTGSTPDEPINLCTSTTLITLKTHHPLSSALGHRHVRRKATPFPFISLPLEPSPSFFASKLPSLSLAPGSVGMQPPSRFHDPSLLLPHYPHTLLPCPPPPQKRLSKTHACSPALSIYPQASRVRACTHIQLHFSQWRTRVVKMGEIKSWKAARNLPRDIAVPARCTAGSFVARPSLSRSRRPCTTIHDGKVWDCSFPPPGREDGVWGKCGEHRLTCFLTCHVRREMNRQHIDKPVPSPSGRLTSVTIYVPVFLSPCCFCGVHRLDEWLLATNTIV